jgi:hypothetical protein
MPRTSVRVARDPDTNRMQGLPLVPTSREVDYTSGEAHPKCVVVRGNPGMVIRVDPVQIAPA